MSIDMNHRLMASQRQLVFDDVTANAYVDAKPVRGETWVVHHAYGYHNHAAGSNVLWATNDGVTGFRDISVAGALASDVYQQLYSVSGWVGELVLRDTQTLRFAVTAKAVGEHATMVLWVDIYKGEIAYAN